MKKKKTELTEQEIIAKHFYEFIENCRKELKFENDEDMGYIFYMSMALSTNCLADFGWCEHRVTELIEGILDQTYPEEEEAHDQGLH